MPIDQVGWRRFSRASLTLLTALACARSSTRPVDPASDVGVGRFDSASGCIAMPRAGIDSGTALAVVVVPVSGDSSPAIVVAAEALAPADTLGAGCPAELVSSGNHLYSARLVASAGPLVGPVFAIVAGVEQVAVRGPVALLAVSPGLPAAELRVCTSNEGVHLTVWRGKRLESQRVFHAYYPLGYDVEPSCVEADFEA